MFAQKRAARSLPLRKMHCGETIVAVSPHFRPLAIELLESRNLLALSPALLAAATPAAASATDQSLYIGIADPSISSANAGLILVANTDPASGIDGPQNTPDDAGAVTPLHATLPVTPGVATLTTGIGGLAFDASGDLWGVTDAGPGSTSNVVQIDTDTGVELSSIPVTLAGQPISLGNLAFDPLTDQMFAIGSAEDGQGHAGVLFQVNTATGVVSVVGNTGTNTDGGLAFTASGTLYFASVASAPELDTLNPATGAILTSVPLAAALGGLAVRGDGVLVGSETNPNPLASDFVSVDPATGAITALAMQAPIRGIPGGITFQPLSANTLTEVYHEDFDSGSGDYTVNNTGGPLLGLWHPSIGRQDDGELDHSPDNSFYYGQYETTTSGGDYIQPYGAQGTITSPAIALPASGTSIVSFSYQLQTRLPTTEDFVEFRVVQGTTVTTLLTRAAGTLPQSGTTQWFTATADLSQFAGQTIELQFFFETDNTAPEDPEGWFVDDITIANIAASGSIQGIKYNDVDGGTSFDGSDVPIPGVSITLTPQSGTAGQSVTQVTASDGSYDFEDVLPGVYTITETPPNNAVSQTPPPPITVTVGEGEHLVALASEAQSGESVTVDPSLAIANTLFGSIHGIKYAVTATGLSPLAGVTLQLTGPGNYLQTVTTGSDGGYDFSQLVPGTYTLTEIAAPADVQQLAPPVDVTVHSGEDVVAASAEATPGAGEYETLNSALAIDNLITTIVKSDNVGGSSSPTTIGSAVPGQTITYTVSVDNPQTGSTVADDFPGTLSSVTWTSSDGHSGSGNISDVVPVGTTSPLTYTITAVVSPTASGTLTNTASVTPAGGGTPLTATDNDNLTTLVKSDSAGGSSSGTIGAVVPGQKLIYTISVGNPQIGSTIADNFPGTLSGVTWTSSDGHSGSGDISDIVPAGTASPLTYTITAMVSLTATGTLVNTASVVPAVGGTPLAATDTDNLATIVKSDNVGGSSPAGGGAATVGNAVPGQSITYTILVTNFSAGDLVSDITSTNSDLTGVTWSSTDGDSGSGDIQDTIPANTASPLQYTIHATVSAAATGTLTNTASLASPAGGTPLQATDSDYLASLTVTKTDSAGGSSSSGTVGNVEPGQPIIYTITVANSGTGAANNIFVDDSLPPDVAITNIANNGSGQVRVTTFATNPFATGETVQISGVGGATEANGTWTVTVISANQFDLQGSTFTSAYTGGGNAVAAPAVADATNNGAGLIRVTTVGPNAFVTGESVTISGVAGTTEANGTWLITVVDPNHFDLQNSQFVHAYTSGGVAVEAAPFLGATWTAALNDGATISAPGGTSGSGDIEQMVDLPAGSSIVYTLAATVSSTVTGVLNNTVLVTSQPPVTVSDAVEQTVQFITPLSVIRPDGPELNQASSAPGTGSGTITGTVWDDINQDGQQDMAQFGAGVPSLAEPGLAGYRVFIDNAHNGTFDPQIDPFAVTNSAGEYTFTGLAPGTYTLGFVQSDLADGEFADITSPAAGASGLHEIAVTVATGQTVAAVNFGVFIYSPLVRPADTNPADPNSMLGVLLDPSDSSQIDPTASVPGLTTAQDAAQVDFRNALLTSLEPWQSFHITNNTPDPFEITQIDNDIDTSVIPVANQFVQVYEETSDGNLVLIPSGTLATPIPVPVGGSVEFFAFYEPVVDGTDEFPGWYDNQSTENPPHTFTATDHLSVVTQYTDDTPGGLTFPVQLVGASTYDSDIAYQGNVIAEDFQRLNDNLLAQQWPVNQSQLVSVAQTLTEQVQIEGTALGGTFTLGLNSQTTPPIPVTASTTEIATVVSNLIAAAHQNDPAIALVVVSPQDVTSLASGGWSIVFPTLSNLPAYLTSFPILTVDSAGITGTLTLGEVVSVPYDLTSATDTVYANGADNQDNTATFPGDIGLGDDAPINVEWGRARAPLLDLNPGTPGVSYTTTYAGTPVSIAAGDATFANSNALLLDELSLSANLATAQLSIDPALLRTVTVGGTNLLVISLPGASVAITNVSNNGGLIQITTSAANSLATGDEVQISGVAGATEANGTWTVTVVDATHFDLQNSAFTQAYTGGGSARQLQQTNTNIVVTGDGTSGLTLKSDANITAADYLPTAAFDNGSILAYTETLHAITFATSGAATTPQTATITIMSTGGASFQTPNDPADESAGNTAFAAILVLPPTPVGTGVVLNAAGGAGAGSPSPTIPVPTAAANETPAANEIPAVAGAPSAAVTAPGSSSSALAVPAVAAAPGSELLPAVAGAASPVSSLSVVPAVVAAPETAALAPVGDSLLVGGSSSTPLSARSAPASDNLIDYSSPPGAVPAVVEPEPTNSATTEFLVLQPTPTGSGNGASAVAIATQAAALNSSPVPSAVSPMSTSLQQAVWSDTQLGMPTGTVPLDEDPANVSVSSDCSASDVSAALQSIFAELGSS